MTIDLATAMASGFSVALIAAVGGIGLFLLIGGLVIYLGGRNG